MEAPALPGTRRPAGNTATTWLKIIALVFMFIDHAGKMLFPAVPEMRILGRIAFPVYVWCMIVGFHYTRSVPKYLLRVLVVGLLSQPLYIIALNHTWREPNVFLTLFLGLCALWGVREKKLLSHLWAPAAALILAVLLNADYGWKGAFFLYWGSSYSLTKSLFGLTVNLNALPDFISPLLSPLLRLETYALLSLPLILIPFGKDLKLPRWVGYALYPGHLLLLYVLELIFK